MTTGPALEMVGLTKRFGDLVAVDALTLRVEPGTAFGFIGPNGAGKSTTIRVLLDMVRPTSGTARVLGMDCHREMVQVHRRIGYLPAEHRLPDDLDTLEYLDFLGRLRGMSSTRLRQDLIERFDVDPTRRLRELSTGNKRKIGLVQAFMHSPELVLLDEPTSGIDPLVQHEFHEFLADYITNGGTAFLSSHTLSEVERVADRVGIIRDGQLVRTEAVAVLKAEVQHRVVINFESARGLEKVARRLAEFNGVSDAFADNQRLEVHHRGPVDPILRAALDHGTITSLRAGDADLEDVFLQYYQAKVATA